MRPNLSVSCTVIGVAGLMLMIRSAYVSKNLLVAAPLLILAAIVIGIVLVLQHLLVKQVRRLQPEIARIAGYIALFAVLGTFVGFCAGEVSHKDVHGSAIYRTLTDNSLR